MKCSYVTKVTFPFSKQQQLLGTRQCQGRERQQPNLHSLLSRDGVVHNLSTGTTLHLQAGDWDSSRINRVVWDWKAYNLWASVNHYD
jgi:hypothetical protein